MTVPGTIDSYDLVNGVIVNMDEAIYQYSPDDLPFINGQSADGLSILSSAPLDQKRFSWMDEDILTPQSTIAATFTTGETTIALASATERLKFSTGDLVMVEKGNVTDIETIRITGYSGATGLLTVTRAFAGTATNYAVTGANIIGIGTALAEGSNPENARAVDRNVRTNTAQIFGPIKIHMSGTARVIPRYGVADEWTKQLRLRMLENEIKKEQAILYGRERYTTADTIRAMGGAFEFISTNADVTNTQVTVTSLNSNLQTCYLAGGVPDRFAANPVRLSNLNDIGNVSIVRTDIIDTKRGRRRVQTFMCEFGDVEIVRNRWILQSHALGFRREQLIRRILRSSQFTMLAKTGDADSAQFLSEESLEVKGQRHMFKMMNLTG